MKEEWKLIKEYKTLSTLHLPGDKIYVSNTGKVKMNDIELTLDRGIVLSKQGEKQIYSVGLSNNLYRIIYELFVGELHHDCWHNVHHIDGNHLNDSVDNLIEVTVYEHGKIHAQDLYWGLKQQNEIQEYYINISNEIKTKTRQWLVSRVEQYKYERRLEREKEIQQQKEKQKINKEKDIQHKLDSGEYYINKNGVLRSKHQHRTKTHNNMTPEGRKRKIEASKRLWIDPECREKMLSTAMKNLEKGRNTKGSKLVIGEDGHRHWVH